MDVGSVIVKEPLPKSLASMVKLDRDGVIGSMLSVGPVVC